MSPRNLSQAQRELLLCRLLQMAGAIPDPQDTCYHLNTLEETTSLYMKEYRGRTFHKFLVCRSCGLFWGEYKDPPGFECWSIDTNTFKFYLNSFWTKRAINLLVSEEGQKTALEKLLETII